MHGLTGISAFKHSPKLHQLHLQAPNMESHSNTLVPAPFQYRNECTLRAQQNCGLSPNSLPSISKTATVHHKKSSAPRGQGKYSMTCHPKFRETLHFGRQVCVTALHHVKNFRHFFVLRIVLSLIALRRTGMESAIMWLEALVCHLWLCVDIPMCMACYTHEARPCKGGSPHTPFLSASSCIKTNSLAIVPRALRSIHRAPRATTEVPKCVAMTHACLSLKRNLFSNYKVSLFPSIAHIWCWTICFRWCEPTHMMWDLCSK